MIAMLMEMPGMQKEYHFTLFLDLLVLGISTSWSMGAAEKHVFSQTCNSLIPMMTTALHLQKDNMDRSKQKGLSACSNGILCNSTITSSPAPSMCCSVGIWPTQKGFQCYGRSSPQTAHSYPKRTAGTPNLMRRDKRTLIHTHTHLARS